MMIRKTELRIIPLELDRLSCEAFVVPTHPDLRMRAGLAAVVKERTGEEVEQEALAHAEIEAGQTVVTSSGRWKAVGRLIHAVTVHPGGGTDEWILRRACQRVLETAASLSLTSLALPALGCGSAGFPYVGAAKIMAQEILKHCRFRDTSLELIQVCPHGREEFATFETTIRGYVTHIQDDLGNGPYVTVDALVRRPEGLILIERSNPPYGWALPGGFVDVGESLEDAVVREVKEETGLDFTNARQFHTYSEPERDPRFHTVSVVFVGDGVGEPRSGDDAKRVAVVPYEQLLDREYAFDHKRIIRDFLENKY